MIRYTNRSLQKIPTQVLFVTPLRCPAILTATATNKPGKNETSAKRNFGDFWRKLRVVAHFKALVDAHLLVPTVVDGVATDRIPS